MHFQRPTCILTSIAVLLATLFLTHTYTDLFSRVPLPSFKSPAEDNMGGGPGFRSVAYFVNWAIYARKHRPQDLPVENLTHILYAFANVRSDTGEVHLTDGWADTDIHWEGDSWNDVGTNLYGCLKQLNLLKRRNRNLKHPDTFARSCVDLIKNLGFDGIDIDWEYPQNQAEASDFVALLQATRDAMDAYASTLPQWYHFELTVACPAGAQNYEKMNLPAMDRLLDFWNLMAYDYAGSWDSTAGHQANLQPCNRNPRSTPFSTAAALSYYTSHGVNPTKIVLGMPLYGRAFENTDGPGAPYSGIGEGSWENGVLDYKVLPLPGSQEYVDEETGASYSYDAGRRKMISYDNQHLARKKGDYIRGWGLGGGMWWESSADKPGHESLIGTVVHAFGGPHSLQRRDNCITYPETKYENLRNGFPNN
uniref:chitinase n=1 Tax=Colletotrichum fructicola (strain Nara gc5) TaxID=1213859 RepID=L2G5I6_COLFN